MNSVRSWFSKMATSSNANVRVHPSEEFPERDLFIIEESASSNGYEITFKRGKTNLTLTLNEEVLLAIFTQVPSRCLVQSCRLVCKSWCNLIDEEVWKSKLRESPVYRSIPQLRTLHWHLIYWALESKCLHRNLIKNPSGEEKMKHWKILSRGGDGWEIETPPVGTEEPHPHTTCFVTSFHSCSKEQTVDLVKEGAVPSLLDLIQPDITASDWIAGRWDCHAVYDMQVSLVKGTGEVVADFEKREQCGGAEYGSQWRKIEHTFTNYGPGVRFIKFYHGGMDGRFWKGHYGSKMTQAEVRLTVRRHEQ